MKGPRQGTCRQTLSNIAHYFKENGSRASLSRENLLCPNHLCGPCSLTYLFPGSHLYRGQILEVGAVAGVDQAQSPGFSECQRTFVINYVLNELINPVQGRP